MAENEKDNLLKNLLGLSPTTSMAVGLPLTMGGLIGALLTKGPDYRKIDRETSAQMAGISSMATERNKAIEAGLTSDLSAYGQKAEAQALGGLQARGITDPAVAKAVKENVATGLSGAYAAAHSTLARAKLNAQNAMSSTMANYQQNLAQMQYQKAMQDYAGKMGIWGALGGLGTGILGLKSTTVEDVGNEPTHTQDPNFRMKGVK